MAADGPSRRLGAGTRVGGDTSRRVPPLPGRAPQGARPPPCRSPRRLYAADRALRAVGSASARRSADRANCERRGVILSEGGPVAAAHGDASDRVRSTGHTGAGAGLLDADIDGCRWRTAVHDLPGQRRQGRALRGGARPPRHSQRVRLIRSQTTGPSRGDDPAGTCLNLKAGSRPGTIDAATRTNVP